MRLITKVLFLAAALHAAALAGAQPATPEQRAGVPNLPGIATMHMKTNVGSFKCIDGRGRIEVSFTGTLLISNLKGFGKKGAGSVQVSGKLQKEFEGHDRVVYFGTGKVVILGEWRGVYFFGTSMRSVWYGSGLAQVAGEFDRDLNTGLTWYDDPDRTLAWAANGVVTLPLPYDDARPKPIPRDTLPPGKRG